MKRICHTAFEVGLLAVIGLSSMGCEELPRNTVLNGFESATQAIFKAVIQAAFQLVPGYTQQGG